MPSSFSNAQGDDSNRIFKAIDWINGVKILAVKSGAIGSEHVIIIDGITIKSQSQLSAALEGIYANSIKDYSVLNNEKAKQHFNTKKGRNGAILFVLDNKANSGFLKILDNLKKGQPLIETADGQMTASVPPLILVCNEEPKAF